MFWTSCLPFSVSQSAGYGSWGYRGADEYEKTTPWHSNPTHIVEGTCTKVEPLLGAASSKRGITKIFSPTRHVSSLSGILWHTSCRWSLIVAFKCSKSLEAWWQMEFTAASEDLQLAFFFSAHWNIHCKCYLILDYFCSHMPPFILRMHVEAMGLPSGASCGSLTAIFFLVCNTSHWEDGLQVDNATGLRIQSWPADRRWRTNSSGIRAWHRTH